MAVLEMSLTPAEYLAQERLAEHRSEYIRGEIYPRPAISLAHDRIVGDLLGMLRIGQASFEPLTSAVRVQLAEDCFVYPDLTVVCGAPVFAAIDVDTLANPTVVFEVLSPSTENYDLGDKARLYRQLESLRCLVLVAQDRPWVEVWTREPDSWRVREYTNLDAVATLPALEVSLPLTEIYRRIPFPES
jgi:Uma2 family endonuclease